MGTVALAPIVSNLMTGANAVNAIVNPSAAAPSGKKQDPFATSTPSASALASEPVSGPSATPIPQATNIPAAQAAVSNPIKNAASSINKVAPDTGPARATSMVSDAIDLAQAGKMTVPQFIWRGVGVLMAGDSRARELYESMDGFFGDSDDNFGLAVMATLAQRKTDDNPKGWANPDAGLKMLNANMSKVGSKIPPMKDYLPAVERIFDYSKLDSEIQKNTADAMKSALSAFGEIKANLPLEQQEPAIKKLEETFKINLPRDFTPASVKRETSEANVATGTEKAQIAEQGAQTASALAKAPIDKEIFFESALRQYPQLNMADPQISQRIMPRAAEIASSYMTATDPVTGKVTSTGTSVDEAMTRALGQLGAVTVDEPTGIMRKFGGYTTKGELKTPGIIPDSPGSRTMLTQELSARVKELVDLGVKEDVARRIAQNDIKKNPKWGQVIAARAKELISQQQGNVQ
jgi:hypothetical protein